MIPNMFSHAARYSEFYDGSSLAHASGFHGKLRAIPEDHEDQKTHSINLLDYLLMKLTILALYLLLTSYSNLQAETVYVDPSDTVARSISLQQTLDGLEPGDTCVFREGVYRESAIIKASGTPDAAIRIIAQGDVVIDGTDPISTPWTRHGAFYRTPLPGPPVEQVFADGVPLTLARWPNAEFSDTWLRSKWATSAEGSKKDLMICNALAETGIDWTGALAVLNVGHQYKTWTRTILSHESGSNEFTYELDDRLGDGKEDGRTWHDDRFYLTDTIKALDAPGEWFHDAEEGYLYLIPEGDTPPLPNSIAVKRRDYGIFGKDVAHVRLSGFRFHGCAVRFENATDATIEDCQIRFPSGTTVIGETMPSGERETTPRVGVTGSDNTIRRVLVAYASGIGISASGRNNRIEDCIVHDVNWTGTINFPGIQLFSDQGDKDSGSTVARCEVFNVGNIGILHRGPSNIIEWNHVHHTGLACRDIAAIHTGSPATRGSVVRYNWVHDSMGKAIRGDDQTRGLTVHHNLVWACDEGIIVKGDDNLVYQNTIIGTDGRSVLLIPTRQEPEKWWTPHPILPVQNLHSRFFNNYSEVVTYRHDPIPQNLEITHNFVADSEDNAFESTLLDATSAALESGEFDPRPRSSSSLVDAGIIIEGVTDEYVGAAPDVGAYESGQPVWRPGPSWTTPYDHELEIDAEVARADHLAHPGAGSSVPLPMKLRSSDLSEDALRKLQLLYDSCWTDEETQRRQSAIRSRESSPESSPAYDAHHAIVAELHQALTQRLIEKGPTVLTEEDLVLFQRIMTPGRIRE